MGGLVERARERHPGLRIEHPPATWSHAPADDVVDGLVDALLSSSSASDSEGGATLLVSNVTVRDAGEVHQEEAWVAAGDYVALTVERAHWELGDSAWRSVDTHEFVDATLDARLRAAGAVYAYTRGAPRPSITCYLPRG